MRKWTNRTIEIRNLFNPAFCGLLLFSAIKEYESKNKKSIPFSLLLLVLPLCLHKETRRIILINKRSFLSNIILKNQRVIVNFASRTRRLIPYTFEALGFMLYLNAININEDGSINHRKRIVKRYEPKSEETSDCINVAKILGRKFAQIDDRVTIYRLFGVRP